MRIAAVLLHYREHRCAGPFLAGLNSGRDVGVELDLHGTSFEPIYLSIAK
jgi:hypothetical protein